MKVLLEIEVPITPNFLRVKGSEDPICISKLTDKELRSVGKAWTTNLINRAAKKRNP